MDKNKKRDDILFSEEIIDNLELKKTIKIPVVNRISNINIQWMDTREKNINQTLFYLNDIKNKIESLDENVWIRIRKYINIYESPSENYQQQYTRQKKHNPISRAYYKLKEILIDFKINCNCNSFHIAESPGGFIQAVIEYKNKKYCFNDKNKCYTVSLEKNNYDIPSYHNSIINNIFVKILNKSINDSFNGDVTNIKNMMIMIEYFKKNNIQLSFITADGGINDSDNFNDKEINHINLIFSEIVLGLSVLENNGTFVIKIFDIYTKSMKHIIYLLSYLFESVYITKPLTSRCTNSEKYIVCNKFKKERFCPISNTLFKVCIDINDNNGVIYSLFDCIPNSIFNMLYQYNEYISKIQAYYITQTLDFIKYIECYFPLYKNDPSYLYNYSFFTIGFNKKKKLLNKKWNEKYG